MSRTGTLLAVSVAALLVGSAAAPRAGAATATPLEKLSLTERLSTAPDSTVVQFGPNSATLGQLRAAHSARLAAFEHAADLGQRIGTKLLPPGTLATHPLAARGGGIGNIPTEPLPILEPASQYASAPPDMRAFCGAAHASACLYLPPGQYVSLTGNGVQDWDGLMTQQQCAQEGGSWGSMWNSSYCAFTYPASVTVHFTPAATYKLSQSASCDPTFHYQVDDHGAVAISVAANGIFTTDSSPTCVVSVTPGG